VLVFSVGVRAWFRVRVSVSVSFNTLSAGAHGSDAFPRCQGPWV